MNLIEEISRRHPPERPAIVSQDRLVSFGELFELARPVADQLREQTQHLGRSPRVGLDCPNGLDYIVLALGILLADGCLVPLAEELTADERGEITRTTCLDFIVSAKETTNPTPTQIPFQIIRPEESEPKFPEAAFQALNPAFIRFSSGTTGSSKGIVLSHQRLLERISAANQGLQLSHKDRVLWMLPMAHHFAVSIVLYLQSGALTILEPSPHREDILATAEKHAATVIYGSPFHFAALAGDTGDFRWPSLRLPIATAAALTEATARAFEARFGQSPIQGLGIIEVGLPALNLDAASSKPTSLGRPLPGYEIQLLDESGQEAPTGTPGEFHIKGPGMLDAYLVPWNPTPLQDGYFASGDLVSRDQDGHLTLVGRSKSVINVAGMKVFPEEIEAVLNLHPGVSRARVAGQAHPQTGQIPVAEIIPSDPSSPPSRPILQKHCREHLSAYKVPLRFTQVESIDLTASGKVKRH